MSLKPTLILSVTHGGGTTNVSYEDATDALVIANDYYASHLGYPILDTANWHMKNYFTQADPQPGVDWLEQNILFPALAESNLNRSDFQYVIVLLPPMPAGLHGFYGYANLANVVWLNVNNTEIGVQYEYFLEYLVKHEIGHHPPLSLNHSKAWRYKDCTYGPQVTTRGHDVMSGFWGMFRYALNPYFQKLLGILTAFQVTPTDIPLRVWVGPMDSLQAIEYAPDRFIYTLPKVEIIGAPSYDGPKLIVQKYNWRQGKVPTTEGTVYITEDNVRVTVKKSAQFYIDNDIDLACVDAVGGYPTPEHFLVELVQVPSPCS